VFLKLLKIFLKENYGAKRFFGAKIGESKKKTTIFLILIIYSFGTMAFSNGMMFYAMNIQKGLLLYVASYGLSIGFLFSLLQANGAIFQFKDYDIVAPLPIKSTTLFLAKLTTMLVFVYTFIFVITMPIIIVYYMKTPFTILGFLSLLFSYFLLPLPGVILGSFLSLLFAKLSKKFKHGSLVQTILLFVVFIGIFLVSILSSANVEQGSMIPVSVMETIALFYVPNEWFASAVFDQNILHFLYLFLLYGGFTTGMIFLIAKLSIKTNQNRTTAKEIIIKDGKRAQKPIILSLIKKEWRKFITTPVYIFNCGFGLIILVALAILSFFFKDQILTSIGPFVLIGILVIYGFSLSTVYTPAISLSLEGKNFGLLKSLPIKGEKILLSKIIFNLLIELPIIFVTFPIFVVNFNIPILTALSSFLLIVSFALATSFYFSWLNVFFPRFDFKTEVEVIKQGMSAFVAIFSGFGLLILQAGLIFLFTLIPYITFDLAVLLLTITNMLLTLMMYLFLKGKADAKLQKLEV